MVGGFTDDRYIKIVVLPTGNARAAVLLWKLFGTLDLLCALLLAVLTWTDASPWRLTLAGAAYLLFKGFLYLGDIGSLIDMGVGVYLLIALIFPVSALSLIFILYLSIKGVWSFL